MNIANKLHQAFRLFADRTAISEEETSITYGSLYLQCLKVAAFLRRQKINNACVAIELENTRDHLIAMLGILLSGNYYVSVTPENKVFFLVENTLPVELIISSDPSNLTGNAVLIGRILEQELTDPSVTNELLIHPSSAICAFFTSGTTGRSKIIVHSHRNILQDTLRQIKENKITSGDKLDLVFSLSFSASLACIFPALLTGAELCIFNLKEKGLHALGAFWQQHAITFSSLSVSSFQGVCKAFPSFHHLRALRFISIGAEPVKDTTIALFRSKFPAQTLLQIAYACTETRTISEIKIYNDGRPERYLESTGKPVAEKQVQIIDENGRQLPAGTFGEILVQSEYIADGYWGQPKESRSSFTRKENIVFYKTGDLGYLNTDGYLFHCGRVEHENKINGIKINLSSIEEEVQEMEGVLQAAAIISKADFDQPKLLCFFQTTKSTALPAEAIKKTLAKQLPATHLPHFYIPLDQLPYTHSGKIDRKMLEQMSGTALLKNTAREPVPSAEGRYELVIINIFKNVLETDRMDANSNFFEAGGDSLTSLFCVAEIESQLNINFSSLGLLAHPTPATLSSYLTGLQNKPADLVKAVELNGYAKEKRNLYLLNNGLNRHYESLLNSPLSGNFNLVELFYELHNSYKIENSASSIIRQLTEIISPHKDPVVMGYSFNGYMAHQLACLLPQISYCILVDTYDYFDFKKYQIRHKLSAKFSALFWQVIKNKDYNFPFYWAKTYYTFRTTKRKNLDPGFLEGVNYLLENLSHKRAINNCIYFQASRSYMFTKNHGLNWKSYINGDFHFINLFSNHKDIIQKNSITMADYINKVVAKI